MLNLEAGAPVCFWTYESRDDYGKGEDVWNSDELGAPIITQDEIVFDYLGENWDKRHNPVRMRLEADGHFHSRNQPEWNSKLHHHMFGVKSETQSHILITGIWSDEGFGKGAFVIVIPSVA